jgi:catechol 2,3-dioxygenase-like lactoylglutathione lyase family enzyme
VTFSIPMMFHPSHRVLDLDATERFFAAVFGRPSTSMAELMRRWKAVRPDYPSDYCTFTPISDVFFDAVDPSRYVLHGVQHYPSITEPHLSGFGFYVDGMADLHAALHRHGIRTLDQAGAVVEGDEPPRSAASDMVLFWTDERDTGLRYELFPGDRPFASDPRPRPGWTIPEVSPDDPLGIERCSHHTVLTGDVDRALRLVVDVLGGERIGEGHDAVRGTDSTFVALSGSVLEYAQPVAPGLAMDDWARHGRADTYHAITWKVADLERVAAHLERCTVGVRTRTDTLVIADPADAIGIPWGFTTQMAPEHLG